MVKTLSILGIALVAACGSNAASDCIDGDGDGVTTCDGDCDDDDPLSFPGGNEICGDGADNNCSMGADEGCGGLGTFVSGLTGTDTNPGTKAAPVKTIAEGMANAASIGGSQTVVVAEGTYAEKVTLAEGVSLYGGYQCDATSCTWARDPVVHDALIQNTDFDGVFAGVAITHLTVVQGFHIVGFDGAPSAAPGSCGVQLAGGAPTLKDNRIIGGNVTGGTTGAAARSAAIVVRSTTDPAGAIIGNNTLTGGTSTGGSVGIAFDSQPASTQTPALATVVGNTIRGGAGRDSFGVLAWNTAAGTLVSKNDIAAGNSNGGAGDGIVVGATMTIDGNKINVDQANVGACLNSSQWCAGIRSASSTTTITNNIIYGGKGARSAAVWLGEFEVAAGTVILNGNTLNGAGIGATSGVQSESAALVVSIGTCTACGFNGFVGRVRNNILDGGTNNLRFGVREDPSAGRAMRVELLENNLFWFMAATGRQDIMYRQVSSGGAATDATTIAAVNALTSVGASANLNADPLLDSAWHLVASSPCIDTGTATEAATADYDGDPRPSRKAIDIGADEMP